MSNTLLTPNMITKEALMVLHQKLNFIGTINRDYDSSFAKDGAKIGDTLRVRLPNQYVVRSGATLVAQDTTENYVNLQVANQKGVDLNFTSKDLTLSMDNFRQRIITPAMAVLAAAIEADALSMILNVYNAVNNVTAALTFAKLLLGRKALGDNLAPNDDDRTCLLNTQDNVDLITDTKGLFQDASAIKQQYREGSMGRTAGFDFFENTLIPTQTTGTAAAATTYTVNGASQTGTSITIQGATTTFAIGDIITLTGCNRCHPETKVDTGSLQQFVITAAYSGGAGSITISPSIVITGGTQNVVASPTNGGAIAKIGAASSVYKPSLVYHKNAFTFATADLLMPDGVDFKARVVMDKVSMRIVRQYDINNDKFPCRVDVLYGYSAIRAQLAARLLSN